MNDHSHNPQIDIELEARIAALVLGEASDLERDQLQRLIAVRPELAELKSHFEAVHGLLHDIGADEYVAPEDEVWKLPTEKRKALLGVIDRKAQTPLENSSVPKLLVRSPTPARVSSKQSSLWKFSKVAAIFCVAGCLGVLAMSGYFFLNLNDAARTRQSNFSLFRKEFAYLPSEASEGISDSAIVGPEFPGGTDRVFEFSAGKRPADSEAAITNGSTSSLLAIRESLRLTDESQPITLSSSLPSPSYLKDDIQYFGGSESTHSNTIDDSNGLAEAPVTGPVAAAESAGWELAKQNAQVQDGELEESKEASKNYWRAEAGQPSGGGAMYRFPVNPDVEPAATKNSGMDGAGLGMFGGGYGGAGSGYSGDGGVEDYGRGLARSAGAELAGRDFQEGFSFNGARQLQPAQDSRVEYAGKGEDSRSKMLGDSPEHNYDAESSPGLSDEIAQGILSPSTGNEPLSRDDFKKLEELAYSNAESAARFGNDVVADSDGEIELNLATISEWGDQKSAAAKSDILADVPTDIVELQQTAVAGEHLSKAYQPWLESKLKSLESGLPGLSSPSVTLGESNAEDETFSTFSLHVSDVSFKLAQAALASGKWPEAAELRIEEFVNAMDYGDPLPSSGEKVACRVEQSIHPFLQQRNVLRISLRTAATGRASDTPLRLTVLLDNSGSMERADRQQTVRRCFELLARQLTPLDQVTLISFARQPRLLADKVSGDKVQQLVGLIEDLPSEGGTNIEAALQLAFEKAREQQTQGAQSRIILLTDGAVNLGDANPESLSRTITTIRDSQIAFDAAGISADGLNDEVLEALTRQGDGRYYLLDSDESADDGFASQIAGALRP
ncbi:MAG: von Willebrand factor type A domain-containing protein, partial [Aureliella sp.]